MDIMYMMIAILIIAAAVLGIVVLYNLGIMSYTERYREMATLKVVGFRDKKIGAAAYRAEYVGHAWMAQYSEYRLE